MWLLLALAVVGSTAAPRPFADARLLLDRRLETLRRLLPDGPTPAADQALLRELAQGARLRSFDARARPAVESGGSGATAFDITASGRFEELERFFRQLALSHRLPDLDQLTLTGTPDAIRLTALVRLPHRPLNAPLPAPPDGARARLGTAPRPQADAFLRDQALALAKSETIAAWRRARRNPRLFLSELGAVVRDRPVVLNHAELHAPPGALTGAPPQGEHEFVVRGLTLGDGPARALESRFERGFLRLSDFLMVRQGGCVRFEARGRSPVVGAEAALPLPSDDPFVQDDAPCRVDRDAEGARVTARAGANKGSGSGPLTLRLRDVDLADVFFALHTLTGAGFLIDGDVTGRTGVDFNRVTLQEARDALAKAAGLRLASAGALTRVAVDRKTALPPVAAAGGEPPMSFALKRAEVRDVLALMSEADAGYAALGPPGFLGGASLWLRDAPLPDVRALLLASAGLGERFDEGDGRRILERAGGGADAPVPVAATAAAERRLELGPHEMAVVEFDLAGVGTGADGTVAFAYSPTGTLLAYRPGDPLADGKVREVQSTDVLIDTDDGPLRLLVPPLK